jgi:2-iminoacetate synthase
MFSEFIKKYSWNEVKDAIYSKSCHDVEVALNKKKCNLDDMMALLSPAAGDYLEQFATKSHNLTMQRFGKTIQLFAPIYLSNECLNVCTYCGFSFGNKIPRKTLSEHEMKTEFEFLKAENFEHILLVTGEDAVHANPAYINHSISFARKYFADVSIEVQPLGEPEYRMFKDSGCDAVLVYQETYHPETYKKYHLKGKKANYSYRLDTPDRIGTAGINKIGIGVLLGLDDWRIDAFYLALHLNYLKKTYWQTRYSISFPRLRPAEGLISVDYPVSDKEFVQLLCALRIFNHEVEMSLSTREPEYMRNHLINIGVTSMSAGSKTNPGGYATSPETLEQFEISDSRSPEQILELIQEQGYEPVWKNWDKALTAH